MSYTFTTSGAIVAKAGKNVSLVWKDGFNGVTGETFVRQLSDDAEAVINATARIDLVAGYTNLAANSKALLGRVASALAATDLIYHDMSGYTSSSESAIMLNVLDEEIRTGLALIKDKNVTDFL